MTVDALNLGQIAAALPGGGRNNSGTAPARGTSSRSFGDVMRSIIKKGVSGNQPSLRSQSGAAVTNDALSALEKLLADAGFDSDAVADMIESLKSENADSQIMLADVMAALENLDDSAALPEDLEGEGMLEISALPYLETILSRFGLSQNAINEAEAGAVEEGRGINLSRLTANLQPLKGLSFWNAAAPSDEDARNRTTELLSRIGLNDAEGKAARSLDSFIRLLENRVRSGNEFATSQKNLTDDLNRFLNTVTAGKGENASEMSVDFFRRLKNSRYVRAKNVLLRSDSPNNNVFSNVAGVNSNSGYFGVPGEIKTPIEGALNAPLAEELSGGVNDLMHEVKRFAEDESILSPQSGARAAKNDTFEAALLRQDVNAANAATSNVSESEGHRPPARTLPAYVLDQVGRQIIRANGRGDSELLLKLKPAHMGRIQMSIDNSSDGLKVSIIAEHEAARDMLMGHSNELRTALMDQGIRLQKIDVQTPFNFDQFAADARQGSNHSREGNRRQRPGSGRSGEGRTTVAGGVEMRSSGTWRGNGSLNLVA